jgi:ergothioneine biosynthesis protein EgtB
LVLFFKKELLPYFFRQGGNMIAAQPRPEGAADAYLAVRAHTEALCAALSAEDQCVQSMPDASPAKWHRAHTTWFFEQFCLAVHAPGYEPFDPAFSYLFNSYYDTVGTRHPRPQRGLLTRPDAAAVGRYRAYVDAAMADFLPLASEAARAVVAIGLQHEQQHQELLLTDMLHAFAQNPLLPPVLPGWTEPEGAAAPTQWKEFAGGVAAIGACGGGFCFDNETPRHRVLLAPYRLASRLVRNEDYLAFMRDGGYATPSLWMSDGFALARQEHWDAPLHWRTVDGEWRQFGPGGLAALNPAAPLRHVSWYEADAFARWAGARLPTEAELEAASAHIAEFTGIVWQWTASAYLAYPGYRPPEGAIGEYNGKFMINQMVLRGGSAATPHDHTRPSYRNFFHPHSRWQFSGLRLAQDIS